MWYELNWQKTKKDDQNATMKLVRKKTERMKFNEIPGVKAKGELHQVLQMAGITYYNKSPIVQKLAQWDYHLLTEMDFAYLMVRQNLLLPPTW